MVSDAARTTLMKREREATPLAPLIGRDEDLTVLLERLAAAEGGAGGAVVLIGEGGVGKTRLADALAEAAGRRGFRVATGRAFPFDSGRPYALFADAFMPVVRDLDRATITTLARGVEAELAVVLPGLGAHAPRPHAEDPSELRSRLLWTVAEFVHSLAARQPLLLLLDDVHWADVSSLELLHFLARQSGQSQLLIVCTYNELERGQRPELRPFEQSLLASGVAHIHRVRPLTRDETNELVQRAFDAADASTREFAAILYGWTRGNVFFVRETLRSLVESGRLHRREDGQWLGWDFAELELPGSIREVILSRLERLSAGARAVADLAAAIGTRCDHALLRASAELPDAALLAAIDELRHQQIIQESTAGGEVLYDFLHPLVRQALYAELGVARARGLHASVAQALEQRYGSDAVAHADELAFHFARADVELLAPKALQYLQAAGTNALERYADREATEYLRLALEQWTADSAVRRDRLMNDLARAHVRLGEYDDAIRLWQLSLRDTGTDEVARATLHRRIGQAYYWSGRAPAALEQYRTGLHILQSAAGTPLEAALRLAAGVCLQELGRADDAKQEIERARAIAEDAGNTGLLARTHRALLLLHIWTGPPEEARAQGERAVALARDAGDSITEFFSEWGLAVLEGLTGNTAAMAEHIAVSERIAEQERSPLLRLWTAELKIELGAAVGDWDEAIATGENAIRLARSLNQRTLLPRLLVWTSLIYLGRGDVARAQTYIDEAWVSSGADLETSQVDIHTVVPAHIGRAALYVATQQFEKAIDVCQRGVEIADRTGYAFWAMHRLLPILAEAHCHLWDVPGALAVEQRIREEAERLGHRVGLAWADTCRALVVWLSGDPAGATKLIRDACAALEAIPVLPDAARLRRQLAGRLAETGDPEGALQELRIVHDIFVRLGAVNELTKTRGMFREIGAKPPARAATSGAEGLTGREIEIARMVADRKSNKAIGRALDISPRTVSTHISNIFRKLEIESRGELTDYVRRHGVG